MRKTNYLATLLLVLSLGITSTAFAATAEDNEFYLNEMYPTFSLVLTYDEYVDSEIAGDKVMAVDYVAEADMLTNYMEGYSFNENVVENEKTDIATAGDYLAEADMLTNYMEGCSLSDSEESLKLAEKTLVVDYVAEADMLDNYMIGGNTANTNNSALDKIAGILNLSFLKRLI